MNGGNLSPVDVTLRNPLDPDRRLTYRIIPESSEISRDWHRALIEILDRDLYLEKNFCFLGFPYTQRTIDYLCKELNQCIDTINRFNIQQRWPQQYWIEQHFSDQAVRYPDDAAYGHQRLRIKHDVMNQLHNHFEILQGTVSNISTYYQLADQSTRYAIRQLNMLCHELESLILSRRKIALEPLWVRPSQITTWLLAPRYELTDLHRQGFLSNRYDRVLGGVYMHWTQIGKTLFEVWRDESAPMLQVGTDPSNIMIGSGATCEAITALKYYSGEFDVDWGRDVISGGNSPWHDTEQKDFECWLRTHGLDPRDTRLSLGYLKIGQVDLQWSFGTSDPDEIWQQLGDHLDIYSIETDGHRQIYDYCWSDSDYKQNQISKL